MKVLITGGNGFAGSHLTRRLLDKGDSVALFDMKFNSNTTSLESEKIRGDVRDYNAVRAAVDGRDVVFHFAAVSRVHWGQQDPYNCWTTNVMGTINVLEACRKAASKPFLLYASSREVYGEPRYLPVDEGHPKNPRSVYGASKLAAEDACISFSGLDESIREVILRFSNVYGSERDIFERVIPRFVIKALRGEDITLYGGDQVLDFTFIDDAVSGVMNTYSALLGGGNGLFGEDLHFVTGRGISVSDLAKMIVEMTGSSSKIVRMDSNYFDVRKFIGDPDKSRKMVGYQPKTRLEQGLKILTERLSPIIS